MVIVIFRCSVPLGKEEVAETPSTAFKLVTSFVRISKFTHKLQELNES